MFIGGALGERYSERSLEFEEIKDRVKKFFSHTKDYSIYKAWQKRALMFISYRSL